MANPVTLDYHVSAQLLTELTQGGSGNGVYAYLWYNKYSEAGSATPWTNIVLNGVPQTTANGGIGTTNTALGTTDWELTLTSDSATEHVKGGKVYLLIQSNPLSDPTANNLVTNIGTTEGNIVPSNTTLWNFGYDTFEVALANASGDVADLSSINSFGHQYGISVTYADNTVEARGYSSTYAASSTTSSPTSIDSLINTAAAGVPSPSTTAPVIDFLTGTTDATNSTLAHLGMIAITPATDNGSQEPTGYGNIWQASNWQNYVTTVGTLTDMKLVGYFNGAEDGAPTNVYHGPGYYAYSVTQQNISGNPNLANGLYFVLSPDPSSQIKGYIAISQASVEGNLYSPGLGGSPAYMFSDSLLQNPYNVDGASPTGLMNTGANNQWGNILTQFFTGFTGGYYGGTGVSIPSSESSPHAPTYTVSLDQNYNWDPTYAFDGARKSGTVLSGQHYDPYAKIFFDNSNVYGTAYGDALTTNFTSSVTVPVYNTSGNQNVSKIDLWGFGATETMSTVPGTGGSSGLPLTNFYAPYTINNYLAPGAADYAVATGVSASNNLSLNLANNRLVVDADTASIQLGIYLGAGNFQYIALPDEDGQHGGGPWQTWQITYDGTKAVGQQFGIASIPIPANFNAVPPTPYSPYTSSGQVGALGFDHLPAVEGATNWYQLIVGGKTYNFYATLSAASDVTALAADGLAFITPPGASQTSLSLTLVPGSMDSLPGSIMEAYSSASTLSGLVQPTSPVAGTLSGTPSAPVLTPIQTGTGQAVDMNSSVYLTAATALGFGWTGAGAGTGQQSINVPSWISAATNKVMAANLAHVDVVNLSTGLSAQSWNVTPDIDGQWLTPTSFNFTSGAYVVRMTEVLADGTTPYGKVSSPVYVVVSATGAITDTAAHISGALDAYQAVNASLTSITISDGNPLTVSWNDITDDAAALALIPGGTYTLNVFDTAQVVKANITALNGNAKVVGIGFTDPGIPTLTFTSADATTYSHAIGEMMGARTITVTGTGTSTEYDYRHGVLSSGANGSGVLELTRQFTTGYTGSGPITSASAWEHDIDSASHVVRDVYTNAVFSALPAPYPVTVASGAAYGSPGPTNLTFTSVEYDYANGGSTPVLSVYAYATVSGPPGSIAEVDTFDVNNHQLSQMFSGFNPGANNNIAQTETFFTMINGAQVVTGTQNFYQYITPVNGNHYTLAEEALDSSGRATKHVFSGLYGEVADVFSSYEHDFLGGVYSGSKYFSTEISGQPFTTVEVDLDAGNNVSRVVFNGVTSQPYSSYEYDYSYENGVWGGGPVVGQKYYYANVEGQAYTSYEVDLDAAGATASVTYSGYTVTATQPYASLEYYYSGGSLSGAYSGYINNIAGKSWTGEQHDFNTSGQLIRQLFTGVTDQSSTSYEYDYAQGNGVLTGQKFYFTNIANQDYSSMEYDYTASGALTMQVFNMNTGGDNFKLASSFGQATIADFVAASDLIELPTSEFANYNYVQNHSTVSGGNTVITGSNGDALTLLGVTTLPGQSDFYFYT